MSSVDEYVKTLCSEMGLEEALVHAIIQTESGGDPYSYRYEPNFKWVAPDDRVAAYAKACGVSMGSELMGQKTSWGVMQVMGICCRELGFTDKLTKLSDVETGILYGCRQLARLQAKYKNKNDLISAYNAGSVRYAGTGLYVNQSYVDKVLRFYENYKKVGVL